MNKYTVILSLVLGSWAISVFGADASSGTYTIDFIRVSDTSGLTYVNPTSDINVKNSSCTSSDMFAIDKDAESYRQIYSALLSAAAASKPVLLWVSTDANDCLNSRQRITVVQVDF